MPSSCCPLEMSSFVNCSPEMSLPVVIALNSIDQPSVIDLMEGSLPPLSGVQNLSDLASATTAFTAQALGAENLSEIGLTAQRAAAVALTLGLAIIALQGPIGWVAFPLMDASPEVTGHARNYYDIRIWSAPAALLNYVLLGWFLGQQRAKTALALQLSLNIINVSLDILFVVGFSWGIAGVAWASLIAEYSAALFGLLLAARVAGVRIFAIERRAFLDKTRLIALFRVNRDIFLRTITLLFAFGYFTAQSLFNPH